MMRGVGGRASRWMDADADADADARRPLHRAVRFPHAAFIIAATVILR